MLCLLRYLTFIYYFKFSVIITGPHFCLYVLFCKCGQFWEVVWQLNFKRKSNMVNGIFMTQMIHLLKLVCINMHIDGFELCNTFKDYITNILQLLIRNEIYILSSICLMSWIHIVKVQVHSWLWFIVTWSIVQKKRKWIKS